MPASLQRFVVLIPPALLLMLSGNAAAQLPQHRFQSLFPAGCRAGEWVEVQVTGADLEGVNQLWFDHPGLRAFHRKATTFVVAVGAETPVGHHDVRLVGPFGVSNARTFVVGDRPERREAEPNNTPAQAQAIDLDSVVNGRLDAAVDIDSFAFEARAGQRVFFDLAGERIETRIDGVLKLLDPAGAEIAASHDHYGPDPFLDVTIPADGRYVLQVHDVVYNGSPEYGYRLTAHTGPHLDFARPGGTPETIDLWGRGLSTTAAEEGAVAGRPIQRISLPGGSTSPYEITPSSFGSLFSYAANRSGAELRLNGPSARTNAVFLPNVVDPPVGETEPNGPEKPQAISIPCEVFGAFGTTNDVDVYRFTARKGEVWIVEVVAERLGSPADPSFTVQKVVEKGSPQDVASGDDMTDPPSAGNPRFATSTVDSAARWQVPEDGTYQVVISDLYRSQRGDARFLYKLHIRPERPDFRLYVVPEDAAQPATLNLRAGGRAAAVIVANRIDGFNGPIRVEARDLPAGVTCEPVVLGQGQTVAPIVFTASPDAPAQVARVDLVGTSRSGDRREILDYTPGQSRVRPEVSREVLSGGMIWPPIPNPAGGPVLAPARVTHGLVMAVRETAPFRLTARPSSLVAGAGQAVEIAVDVSLRAGVTEAIQVATTDLPPNVPAANATVAKGSNEATIKLTIPANAPPGSYTILVRGTAPFPFSKDPNARPKPNVNVTEPSNPVALTIHR